MARDDGLATATGCTQTSAANLRISRQASSSEEPHATEAAPLSQPPGSRPIPPLSLWLWLVARTKTGSTASAADAEEPAVRSTTTTQRRRDEGAVEVAATVEGCRCLLLVGLLMAIAAERVVCWAMFSVGYLSAALVLAVDVGATSWQESAHQPVLQAPPFMASRALSHR